MSLASRAGANTQTPSRPTTWISARRAWLQIALLLLSTGVLYAAVTVAAAREPDPQGAYGPPPPPDSAPITAAVPQIEAAPAPILIAADPAVAPAVVAVSSEIATAEVVAEPISVVQLEESGEVTAPTPTSSVVESPMMIASSWSMSPLPEGEGGVVTSSTSIDPITQNSAIVASPQ